MTPQSLQCPACRTANASDAAFCFRCGSPLTQQSLPSFSTNSNKTLWITLGIIFAVFGSCGLCGIIGSLSDKSTKRTIANANAPASSKSTAGASQTATPKPTLAELQQRAEPAASQIFSPAVICSVPKEVAANTPFAKLGGGTWGKWNESGGELDHGCNGGEDSIKLKDDGNVQVIAEYGAIGGRDAVHYVSAEYTAMQYTAQTPAERQLRQQYADFCDRLALKFYGVKLDEKLRTRILDESTYSPSGTRNEYAEKIGNGYVNLFSNKNKTVLLVLHVQFFSSEAEYKRYKDS
jgi:hypothetical protein